MRQIRFMLLALVVALGADRRSGAAIHAVSEEATLEAPSSAAEAISDEDEWSLLAWIRPDALSAAGRAAAVALPGAVEISVTSAGDVSALIRTDKGDLELVAPAAAVSGAWSLVALAVDGDSGALYAMSENAAAPIQDVRSLPGDVNDASAIAFGAHGDAPAMLGLYGLAVIRRGAVIGPDIAHLFAERRYFGPYDAERDAPGSGLTGTGDCLAMHHHAVTTKPRSALSDFAPIAARAALIDGPVTDANYHVFDRTTDVDRLSLRTVRDVTTVAGFTYRSPHDPIAGAFFRRDIPAIPGPPFPDPAVVSGPAPQARIFAEGPTRLMRIVASGNSRAARRNDGSGFDTGNHAEGFLDARPEIAAGTMFRAAVKNSGRPWFSLDTSERSAFFSGGVAPLGVSDFSRFWTAGVSTAVTGPGDGLRMSLGAAFCMRARPEGLIDAGAPLRLRAHVLSFPGSGDLRWALNKHSRQGEPGENTGPWVDHPLDTTRTEHVFRAGADDYNQSSATLTIDSTELDIREGDALVIGERISIASAVSVRDGRTEIRLEHPFGAPPADGERIRIGGWLLAPIDAVFPALEHTDPAIWRGLMLENLGPGPVVLYALDAWRPDAWGVVSAAVGWGGNGYGPQIDHAFSAAMRQWIALTEADVWFQVVAPQQSAPEDASRFADIVEEVLPACDIVYAGDAEHNSQFLNYHRHMIEAAPSEGRVAISLLNHPQTGTLMEQLVDGLRSDTGHYSGRGAARLAELWTDALLTAALPADADLDGDGLVGAPDLATLIAAWGPCEGPCPADLDGDGVVGRADLAALVASWN
jgi:hypothetical protein